MGSNETATATTGGPRVIYVFAGNGAPYAVEAMLIRTRLFQRCPVLRSLQEGDESGLAADAGPINGTYCRRYRDAAVATRASFNENPWELMRNNNR